MASALFNVFFKIVGTIVGIFTAPINLILVNFFPNFASTIATFNNAVSSLIGGSLAWFSSMLPPITKTTILLYIGILITYYTIAINVHIILKVIAVLKNLKFW